MAEEQGILEGKIVHAHSNGCMMGGVSTDSGEIGLPDDHADSC